MIDFPSSPTVGQVVTATSGVQWRWDGTTWLLASQGGGARGVVAYAQTTASQGPITSETNLAGLSVSPVLAVGRTYRVTGVVRHNNTIASEGTRLYLRRGGTQIARSEDFIATTSSNIFGVLSVQAVVTPTVAGAATFALSMRQDLTGQTGSTTMMASSDNPAFILVEDITYEAGSSGLVNPFGPAASDYSIGSKVSDGVATTMARSDHKHGNPVGDFINYQQTASVQSSIQGSAIELTGVRNDFIEVPGIIYHCQAYCFFTKNPADTTANVVLRIIHNNGTLIAVGGTYHFVAAAGVSYSTVSLSGFYTGVANGIPQYVTLQAYTEAGWVNANNRSLIMTVIRVP